MAMRHDSSCSDAEGMEGPNNTYSASRFAMLDELVTVAAQSTAAPHTQDRRRKRPPFGRSRQGEVTPVNRGAAAHAGARDKMCSAVSHARRSGRAATSATACVTTGNA